MDPEATSEREEESTTGGGHIEGLPEGCIANILSFTSPADACNLASVSRTFRSAADSDSLWERFLPSDYHSIIDSTSSVSPSFASKKHLFYSLSHNPILIDGSMKSFWLDKRTGNKCFMLGARDLSIVWMDTPEYWTWTLLPESRFPDVAELRLVWWLEIRGKIDTSKLSPKTCYAAYLVFKWLPSAYGFYHHPTEVSVGIAGSESNSSNVCLAPSEERRRNFHVPLQGLYNYAHRDRMRQLPWPKERRDGWLEIELGEYFNESGEDGELEMSVREVKGGMAKGGLVVEGIEIRPKAG